VLLNLNEIHSRYNLKVDGVIHIGAHYAEEHNTYKSLNIDNIVYFEPVSKTFKVLSERIIDAKLFNFALGNENKQVEMFIEAADAYGCSSILEPSSNYKDIEFSGKEIVEMRRLDDFNFTGYNFLNIDVQGYELEVLKGAEKTLHNIDYIMSEIHIETPLKPLDYIGAPKLNELITFLAPYGFRLAAVNLDGISWGDGFFIKIKS